MMRPRPTLAAAALALVLAMAAAGPAFAQGQNQQASLRVVHAMPGGPPVDVFVDSNRVFANVQYKQVTDYAVLSAGGHNVRVVLTGGRQQPLFATTVVLGGGSYSTVAALGQVGSARPLALPDNSTLPVTSQARLRAVHASPDAPAVDIATRGGAALFGNLSFAQVSNYQVIQAQSLDVEIRAPGTSNVVKDVPSVTLNGASVNTIFLVGLANGQPPLEVINALDSPPSQAFRAVQLPQVTATPGQTASPQPTVSPLATLMP